MLGKFVSLTRKVVVGGLTSFALLASPLTMAGLPAINILQGSLIDPTTADSYFGSAPVQAATISPPLHRDIVDLAQSLGATRLPVGAYALSVYQYIYNNVDVEFRYGLGKGAAGALIDGSGTPFDQAQLMMLLLQQQSGNSVVLEAGTVTLTAAQFQSWTNISNAQAACRLLADGGIPAAINGTTDPTCNSYSGAALSSVKMSHVWVNDNGTNFDPSYKQRVFHAPMSNLESAMGCSSSSNCGALALASAMSTNTSGSSPSAGFDSSAAAYFVQNLNANALNAGLGGFAGNLESNLLATLTVPPNGTTAAVSIEDVIGGATITPPVSFAQSAIFPFASSTVQHSWSAIPNAYRTQIGIQIFPPNGSAGGVVNLQLFADEIYAKQIANTISSTSPLVIQLSDRADNFYSNLTNVTINLNATTSAASQITLSINHPYPAGPAGVTGAAGNYADQVVTFPYPLVAPSLPQPGSTASTQYGVGIFSVVLRLGAQGTGSITDANELETNPITTAWLTAASRASSLLDAMNGTNTQTHHSLGLAFGSFQGFAVTDVRASVSVTSTTMSPTARSTTIRAATVLDSALEGGALEQQGDTWNVTAGVEGFATANGNGEKFYEATSSNIGSVFSRTSGYSQSDESFIESFLTANNDEVILPNSGSLGTVSLPGGSVTTLIAPLFAFADDDSLQAYVTTAGNKGASDGSSPLANALDSVEHANEVLSERKQYSLDVGNGTLTYTPPADIVTGVGKFPYSLSFQRTYDSDYERKSRSELDLFSCAPCGTDLLGAIFGSTDAWTTNWSMRATFDSDPMLSLAQHSPGLNGVQVAAALAALNDLLSSVNASTPQPTALESRMTAILVANWLSGQFLENNVIVRQGGSVTRFVRRPNGLFRSPVGSAAQLVQSGSRVKIFSGFGYDYGGITLAMTDPQGSTLSFIPDNQAVQSEAGAESGEFFTNSFLPKLWAFPDGMQVSFNYQAIPATSPGDPPIDPAAASNRLLLTSVSNSLGRKLIFTASGNPISGEIPGSGVSPATLTVTDESGGRSVVFQQSTPNSGSSQNGAATFTDANQQLTKYQWGVNGILGINISGGGPGQSFPTQVFLPTNPSVAALTIAFDANQRVTSVTDALGDVTHVYAAHMFTENLAQGALVDAVGATTVQYFDSNNHLVENIDPLNRVSYKVYFDNGLLFSALEPEGNQTQYSYDVRGNVTAETRLAKSGSQLTAPPPVKTAYMEGPSVLTCANPANCNKPSAVTDSRQNTTSYAYNSAGQLTSVTEPALSNGTPQTFYCYTPLSPLASIGSAPSLSLLTGTVQVVGNNDPPRVTKYAYNSSNKYVLQTATVDPTQSLSMACGSATGTLNLVTSLTFDSVGNVTSIVGPRTDTNITNDVTSYHFSPMRRLTRIDSPPVPLIVSGFATAQVEYTRYTYDSIGELLTTNHSMVANPADSPASENPGLTTGQWQVAETRTYFPTGDLQSVTDAEGHQSNYVYDADGRQTIANDPDGRPTGTAFDAAGQIVCIFKPWSSQTAAPTSSNCNSWSPSGYVANSARRDVAYTYTPNGKQQTVTDANNNVTKYAYDGLDRLGLTLFPDPDAHTLCTPNGDGTAGINAPACTGGQTYELSQYDANDNRQSFRTRRGDTLSWTYNPLNLPLTKSVPGLAQVSYGYFLTKDPQSVAYQSGHTTSYDYDGAGRKRFEQNDGGAVSYGYDQAGNRTLTQWPDGYAVSYVYDALNRMSGAYEGASPSSTAQLAAYQYDVLGRRTLLEYANSASYTMSYGYDTLVGSSGAPVPYQTTDRLSSLTDQYGGSAVNFGYSRNGSGQITTLSASNSFFLPEPTVASTKGYHVNGLNEYTATGTMTGTNAAGSPIIAGAFGKIVPITVGNLYGTSSSKCSGATPTTSSSDCFNVRIQMPLVPAGKSPADNSVDPGGSTIVSDPNGNLVRWTGPDGTRNAYTYDAENRLRTAATSAKTVSYDYDALGRRITKTVNGVITGYLLDDDEEIAEYNMSSSTAWSSVARRYVMGPVVDDRIADVDSSDNKNYYFVNQQGSVIATTQVSGTPTVLSYDEYGNLSPGSSSTGEAFRYTGRRFDAETGLYYYRARYYTPQLGRFLQSDPVGYDDNFNLYVYADNDPLNGTDPSGASELCVSTCPLPEVVIPGFRLPTIGEALALGARAAASAGAAAAAPVVAAGLLIGPRKLGNGDCYVGGANVCGNTMSTEQGGDKPTKEDTPSTKPDDFEPVKGTSGKKNKETGEIWEKDKLHKDHYEVYKNKKDYQNGDRDREVWTDGRLKGKF